MRILIQRVKEASVSIGGVVHSRIGAGMLVLVGVGHGDTAEDAGWLVQKCLKLRIFDDAQGVMNLDVMQTGGSVLAVSQFTLQASTKKGNRPSYVGAADPVAAEALYEDFVGGLRRELGEGRVLTGVFRSMMEVGLINDGPVTIWIDSKNKE